MKESNFDDRGRDCGGGEQSGGGVSYPGTAGLECWSASHPRLSSSSGQPSNRSWTY